MVVVSVDQPTDASVVAKLESELARSLDAQIAVPRHDGRNGHPPIFRSPLLPELRSATEPGQGLRELRRRHAERTIFVEMDNPIVTLNLNTPDAYRSAIALL